MTQCPTDAALLSWLDRENPTSEIDDHVPGCPACQSRSEAIRLSMAGIDDLLSELSELPRRAASAPLAGRKPMFLKRLAAGAAIAACVSFAGFLLRQPVPPYKVDRFISFDNRQDPVEFGTVIRISVPVSLLDPSVVANDPRKVQAEVLLGDDGHPRAVRFLN